jgi:hypothetical protein
MISVPHAGETTVVAFAEPNHRVSVNRGNYFVP